MLGKLLKHEWKAVWKIPTILIGILLVLSVVSGIPFIHPLWHSHIQGLDVLSALIWMTFYIALIGINMGIIIFLAVRFYKSMFTDEGYLTHTLPVTSHQLLISKILPMIAWMILSIIGVMVSLLIFGSMMLVFLKPNDVSFWEAIGAVIKEIKEAEFFWSGLRAMLGSLAFMGISGILNNVMVIVGSVCIGQLVSKHKILGSILAYFAISTVMQIAMGMALVPVMFTYIGNESNVFKILTPTYWIGGVMEFVISIALYFLSEYLIRKKLNLE